MEVAPNSYCRMSIYQAHFILFGVVDMGTHWTMAARLRLCGLVAVAVILCCALLVFIPSKAASHANLHLAPAHAPGTAIRATFESRPAPSWNLPDTAGRSADKAVPRSLQALVCGAESMALGCLQH